VAATQVMAIDQGTTSSRALVVDGRGEVLGVGQLPFTQHFPQPGWVEHDADEIWATTQAAMRLALEGAGVSMRDLAAIGITNQRETVVAWERASGRPVGRAIVWQDRRTAGRCQELREAGHEALVHERTGLTIDPYFSGTKLGWLLGSSTELRARAGAGDLAAGTIDTWLLWNLTVGRTHATDLTNASRTMLFDIRKRAWDSELCELLGVPEAVLPEVLPSMAEFGRTEDGVPVLAIAGDQQAALFGQGCHRQGMAKNTYGTGCFLLANAGEAPHYSRNRLLTSFGAGASTDVDEYVLEGSVFMAGAVVQWLRDEMGIIEDSGEVEGLAASVEDSGGVTLVPAFTGLGAPYWDAEARGAILGLTRGSGRGHIARAALEAIALSSTELLEAMEADLDEPVRELRVDGGAARNDLLMQMQADFSGVPGRALALDGGDGLAVAGGPGLRAAHGGRRAAR
jgi:glycerol kinase